MPQPWHCWLAHVLFCGQGWDECRKTELSYTLRVARRLSIFISSHLRFDGHSSSNRLSSGHGVNSLVRSTELLETCKHKGRFVCESWKVPCTDSWKKVRPKLFSHCRDAEVCHCHCGYIKCIAAGARSSTRMEEWDYVWCFKQTTLPPHPSIWILSTEGGLDEV